MQNQKCEMRNGKGFSLVELIIVIMIIGILTVVSYIAIERSRSKAMNDKMLDDLVAIANALEDYKRDHQLFYPVPEPKTEDPINQNVLCYYADATYAHSCDPSDGAVFVQGMIDNNLLSRRYLRDVPTDPRTGSRYVYGVTNNRKYFQVAGIYEREDGTYEARTVENLVKGFELPSIIRAYDSANFVIDKETYLPYSPDHLMLTARIQNKDGNVSVKLAGSDVIQNIEDGFVLHSGDTVYTIDDKSSADIYFSDGSITHVDPNSQLIMENMKVVTNDKDGTITNILLNLKLGKIWSKVARLAQNSTFDIKTTGAIAGVRGTEYGVEVYPDSKMLKEVTVLSGDVKVSEVTPEGTAGNTIVDIYGVTPDSPQIVPFTNGVAGTVTTANKLEIFKDYYKYSPLNSGIRPHIISAKYENGAGKLVIRNVNFFANIVNAKFGLSDDSAHRVQANTLAIYDLNYLNNPIIPRTDLPNTEPQILPYEITIPSDASGISLVARFEYWKDDKLISASRYSMPPINMEDGTNLTEEQLYPNLFQTEQPALTIDAPPYFALKKGTGDTLTPALVSPNVKVTIEQAPANVTFTPEITPKGEASVCDISFANGIPTSSPFEIKVNAKAKGDCVFSVTVSFSDGKVLTADTTIKIVSETDQIILLSPPKDAVLQANQDITLKWDAPGAQTGVNFYVTVDSSSVLGSPTSLKELGYRVLSTPKLYNWNVTMKNASGDPIATQDGSFSVSNINVNFDINSAVHINWNTAMTQGNVIAPPPPEISLSITASPSSGSYTYDWNYSPNFKTFDTQSPQSPSAVIDTANIPVSTSQYYNITLTVRDSNQNAVGMMTKGITVMNYPRFTVAQFSTAEPYIIDFPTNPTNFPIPDLLFTNPPAVAPIAIGFCDSLKDYAGQTVNPVAYNVPASGDTLTCTINEGKIINGYVAANATTTVLQIRGQFVCGNQNLEGNELCETTGTSGVFNLNGKACGDIDPSKPYGKLSCKAPAPGDCTFDTSGCKSLADMCNSYLINQPTGKEYYDSANNICWLLGLVGESCNTVCNNAHPTGDTETKLVCDTGSWNADDTVCNAFGATIIQNLSDTDPYNPFAPFTAGTYCKLRSANPSLGLEFSCSDLPASGRLRICKCVGQ